MESHLLQMRGLKRLPSTIDARTLKSHLLQMRGLKPNQNQYYKSYSQSHLLQMRGLKLLFLSSNSTLLGRIFYRCVD